MPFAKSGSYTDTFDGPSFNAEWQQVASPTIVGGQAHMPTGATKSRLINADYFDFVDSGSSVKVVQAGSAVNTIHQMLCTWDLAPGNYAQFYVNGNTIVLQRANNNVQTNPWTATYDPVAHLYWRVRTASGVFIAETSPDGINWTVRDSTLLWFDASQGWTEFSSQLISGGGTPQDFVIDDYNVLPAVPVGSGPVKFDRSAAVSGLEDTHGLPIVAGGAVAADSVNPEAYVHNGFSFTAAGRVRIAPGGVVAYVHNDYPMDATGAIVTTTTDPGISSIHNNRRRGSGGLYATVV